MTGVRSSCDRMPMNVSRIASSALRSVMSVNVATTEVIRPSTSIGAALNRSARVAVGRSTVSSCVVPALARDERTGPAASSWPRDRLVLEPHPRPRRRVEQRAARERRPGDRLEVLVVEHDPAPVVGDQQPDRHLGDHRGRASTRASRSASSRRLALGDVGQASVLPLRRATAGARRPVDGVANPQSRNGWPRSPVREPAEHRRRAITPRFAARRGDLWRGSSSVGCCPGVGLARSLAPPSGPGASLGALTVVGGRRWWRGRVARDRVAVPARAG